MNMRNTGLLFLVLGAAVPACSSDNNSTPTDAAAGSDAASGGTPAATLSTSATLGAHLVDKDGKTLYFYVADVPGSPSACTGACLTTWPPADLGTTTTVGTGLTAADFASITTNSAAQTTWKGRPLYHYSMDAAVGDTKGENANSGHWFVARAYNLFFAVDSTVDATAAGGTDKTTPFLTAGNGRAIYVLSTETPATTTTPPVTKCGPTDGTGTSVGACAKKWPLWAKPATVTTPVVPSTLNAADLSSFNAESSMVQFTYKGWPTYFYAPPDTSTPPVNVAEPAGKKSGALVANWFAISGACNGTTF